MSPELRSTRSESDPLFKPTTTSLHERHSGCPTGHSSDATFASERRANSTGVDPSAKIFHNFPSAKPIKALPSACATHLEGTIFIEIVRFRACPGLVNAHQSNRPPPVRVANEAPSARRNRSFL